MKHITCTPGANSRLTKDCLMLLNGGRGSGQILHGLRGKRNRLN
jgi:hypothetical protein